MSRVQSTVRNNRVSCTYLSRSSLLVSCLPLDLLGEEFGDQALIVRLELRSDWSRVGLGVEVVAAKSARNSFKAPTGRDSDSRVEGEDVGEGLLVVFVLKVGVGPLAVPGVEGVEADHVERRLGEGGLLLHDEIEVLVVAP
jgi:hypothetical protein